MLTDDEQKLEEILSIGRVKDNNKSAETERQTEKREKKITPLFTNNIFIYFFTYTYVYNAKFGCV